MSFSVFRENYIPEVGSPLLVVVLGRRSRGIQGVETYLFICGKARKFVPELRDWYLPNDIPAEIIDDGQFVTYATSQADGMLENLIFNEYGKTYELFLQRRSGFKDVEFPEIEIMNLAARWSFRNELLQIANATQDGGLTELIETKCRRSLSSEVQPFE